MKQLNDPVFGPLKWHWYWEGSTSLPGLGAVELLIDGDEDSPPEPAQYEAYRQFLASEAQFLAAAEAALFDYYHGVKETYREALSSARRAKAVPELARSGDIWPLLSDPRMMVPSQLDDQPRQIKLSWKCTWDDEHGVEVRLEDGEAVAVDIIGGT